MKNGSVFLLALLVVLAACGGDDSGGSASNRASGDNGAGDASSVSEVVNPQRTRLTSSALRTGRST